MSAAISEGAVEAGALSWLSISGWEVVAGDSLAPDGPLGARSDWRQAVLEGELRSALAGRAPMPRHEGVAMAA